MTKMRIEAAGAPIIKVLIDILAGQLRDQPPGRVAMNEKRRACSILEVAFAGLGIERVDRPWPASGRPERRPATAESKTAKNERCGEHKGATGWSTACQGQIPWSCADSPPRVCFQLANAINSDAATGRFGGFFGPIVTPVKV